MLLLSVCLSYYNFSCTGRIFTTKAISDSVPPQPSMKTEEKIKLEPRMREELAIVRGERRIKKERRQQLEDSFSVFVFLLSFSLLSSLISVGR